MFEVPKHPFGRTPIKPTPDKQSWDKEKKDATN